MKILKDTNYFTVLDRSGFEKDFRLRRDGEADRQQEVGREADDHIAEDNLSRFGF